jgi:hypothetical protein
VAGSRRTRGTGGLFPIAAGVWRVDIELPGNPGKNLRRVSRRVYGSRAEAERELEQILVGASPDTQAFSVRLPRGLAEAVKAEARERGISASEAIRIAVANSYRSGSR